MTHNPIVSHAAETTRWQILPTPPDIDADIAALLDRAMGLVRFTRAAERLREGNKPIDVLSYIARTDQQIVGTISYWPITIGMAPALLLGPLAVAPECHNTGIGRNLLKTSLDRLDQITDHAGTNNLLDTLLVGDLDYYQAYGFKQTHQQSDGIIMPAPCDSERVLIRNHPLSKTRRLQGRVRAAPLS